MQNVKELFGSHIIKWMMEVDEISQGTSEEDSVLWCRRGYDKFWLVPSGFTGLGQMEKENQNSTG